MSSKVTTVVAPVGPGSTFQGGLAVPGPIASPAGAGYMSETQATELAGAAQANLVAPFHAAIVTASSFKSAGIKEPTPREYGCFMVLEFTIGNDVAWRQFKIPTNFAGNCACHIHWVKSVDTDQSGKAVKWRVDYKFVASNSTTSDDLLTNQLFVDTEQEYTDTGLATRPLIRTLNMPLVGATPGLYLGLSVQAVAPVGAPIGGEPSLFSLDISFDQYINRA